MKILHIIALIPEQRVKTGLSQGLEENNSINKGDACENIMETGNVKRK